MRQTAELFFPGSISEKSCIKFIWKSKKSDLTGVCGKYSAHDKGNCRNCHSKTDYEGKQIEAGFAGGFLFVPTEWSQGFAFVSANITPHKTTGIMRNWTEESFIARFKTGRTFKRTPMPWGCYSRMDESDLKAFFNYFQ